MVKFPGIRFFLGAVTGPSAGHRRAPKGSRVSPFAPGYGGQALVTPQRVNMEGPPRYLGGYNEIFL
jgi:hypothetical protein